MKLIIIKAYLFFIKTFKLFYLNEKIYKLSLHALGFNNEGNFNFTGEIIMSKLLSLDSSNNLFLDVGGNKGDYSSMILKNTKCNVILYEPQKIHEKKFNLISKRYPARFNYQSIGISDFKGDSKLAYQYEGSGQAKISSINLNNNYKYEKIKVDFIDNLFQKYEKIDGMKIDVEGHELSVINGANKLIAENQFKFIQIEFNTCQLENKNTLFDFISLLEDFIPYRILPSGIGLLKINPASEYDLNYIHQNVIFIRKNMIKDVEKSLKIF
jgi:FkbM family methyltransferase